MGNTVKLFIISHTHWDREWYQTFEGYRKRLVYMLDELIDHMENNDSYKFFHLDGQTVVLEDYLEIRPENETRLRKLIKDGRIMIGPWFVMPDEFLVSGESLVRNLKKGSEICSGYGVSPLPCGYVVDIFGHNSQFPQILKGFGIDTAVLYRGIGDYPKDMFDWMAADGSCVTCCKLDGDRSYSSFYFAMRWPFSDRKYDTDELVRRGRDIIEYMKNRAVSDNILMLDGVDHIEIEPQLDMIIRTMNEKIEGIEAGHCRLEDYIKAQKDAAPQLETISGELYNTGKKGVNNQVLKNVLSSMAHLKQMNNRCETLLTKWAEPFGAAASLVKKQDTEGFFDRAWKYLLLNHPHDSICGCSIPRVHQDNEYRFRQSGDIANELISKELGDIVSDIDTSGCRGENILVIFNPCQKEYSGMIEAELEFPAGSGGNFRIYDGCGDSIPYQIINVRKNVTTSRFVFRKPPEFPLKDYYRILFDCSVPPIGFITYSYTELRNIRPSHGDYSFREYHEPNRHSGSMQAGHKTWDNGILRVSLTDNGTLNVLNKKTGKVYEDLLIFEDTADIGDGWNYVKPANDSRYLSLNNKCDVTVVYDGPFAVRWQLTHHMEVPEGIKPDKLGRSCRMKQMDIVTSVTMKKGSSMLEFVTDICNEISDHRVRVMFPTYIDTCGFYSATPFFMQERDIQRKNTDDYNEIDTGVSPNQGIVMLKDKEDLFALYNKGSYEIEITQDESHTAALTLFRSFGGGIARDFGEQSYMRRKMTFEYALEFASADTGTGSIAVSGDMWRSGTRDVYTDRHEGSIPPEYSFLKTDIPSAVISSYRCSGDGMHIVRLYNCTDEQTQGCLECCRELDAAYALDLKDEIIGEIAREGKKIPIRMNAAQIITIGFRYKVQ